MRRPEGASGVESWGKKGDWGGGSSKKDADWEGWDAWGYERGIQGPTDAEVAVPPPSNFLVPPPRKFLNPGADGCEGGGGQILHTALFCSIAQFAGTIVIYIIYIAILYNFVQYIAHGVMTKLIL